MDARAVALLPAHHDRLPSRFRRSAQIGAAVGGRGIVVECRQRVPLEPAEHIALYSLAQCVVDGFPVGDPRQPGEKLPVFGRVGRSLLQILRECRRMSFLFHGVVRLVQR